MLLHYISAKTSTSGKSDHVCRAPYITRATAYRNPLAVAAYILTSYIMHVVIRYLATHGYCLPEDEVP